VRTLESLPGILTALLAAGPFVPAGAWAAEPPAIAEAATDRMIGLNRRAFVEIREQHFQAAKYHLSEALVISETAGLESDEMTARTYVHLAVVHLAGFKDREEALRNFKRALKINPNITITPGLESPPLKTAYLQAREELGLPPNPDATAPLSPRFESEASAKDGSSPEPTSPALPTLSSAVAAASAEALDEPDVPARVPLPVYCPLPFDVPADQEMVVRCVTQKQQKKASAVFRYRRHDSEGEYTRIPMQRSSKGWLVAVIPSRVVHGKSLVFFVEARIPLLPEPVFFGHAENPNLLPIRAPVGADDDDADAVATHSPQQAADVPGRLGRLRVPGTWWLGLAGGSGVAYHGREVVDSNSSATGTTLPVHVRSGFSATSLFQVEPEIGYQLSRRFALSVMGRYQYAPKDADGYLPAANEHAIITSAFAAFVRAHLALLARGRFEASASVGAGGGTSFLAVVPKQCRDDGCTLNHSDTVHGSAFGVLGGVGAMYTVAAHVGIVFDVKEIVTLPRSMAATEVSLGVILAQKLRSGGDPKQAGAAEPKSWR
jgi:hypothetical protein